MPPSDPEPWAILDAINQSYWVDFYANIPEKEASGTGKKSQHKGQESGSASYLLLSLDSWQICP